MPPKSPATSANKYDGFLKGSSKEAQCRSPFSPEATALPFESKMGNFFLSASTLLVNMLMQSGLS